MPMSRLAATLMVPFAIALPRAGAAAAMESPSEILFDRPGLVTLGCNIHDWMVGYVMVVSTPHFGKTDASGNVRLRELPAGGYQVHVWHPQQRASAAPRAIAIDANAAPVLVLTLDIVPRKAKYKPPLDRLKY
jgi:hypothetical protein